ncbi:MAG TPA: hypothetical protein VKU01_07405 [Bryobacteraceae bacterium]|nr:hypothetical protein [Bryobacteraceae bacterium]
MNQWVNNVTRATFRGAVAGLVLWSLAAPAMAQWRRPASFGPHKKAFGHQHRTFKALRPDQKLDWKSVIRTKVSGDTAKSVLNGNYFVREVLLSDYDYATGQPSRARSITGLVTFDGQGAYAFTGVLMDTLAGGQAQNYTSSGQYVVYSQGMLIMDNIIDGSDTDFGGVGTFGPSAFVASATEGLNNDILVGVPMPSTGSLSTVAGNYRAGYIDFLQGDMTRVRDASFALNADGQGNVDTVSVTGFAVDRGSVGLSQNISGVNYVVDPATALGAMSFGDPNSNQLISGTKIFVLSQDGNLLVGGDPNGFDVLVATPPGSGSNATASYNGTYYYAMMADDASNLPSYSDISTAYGTDRSDGSGVSITHQRYDDIYYFPYDYTADANPTFDSTGIYQTSYVLEMLGAQGHAVIGVGSGSYYTLLILLQSQPYAGTGIFVDPQSVSNSANHAPVTNPIAPGEIITLQGSGFATDFFPPPGQVLSPPFLPLLGGVTVTVNNRPAPLMSVSPTQITFIAPFGTGGTDSSPEYFATIQVNAGGTDANPVTLFTTVAAPGVVTTGNDGVSLGFVKKASDASTVSTDNPVRPGDNIVIYCTGLGQVSPPVGDGVAAASNPASVVNANVYAYIDGVPAPAGLPILLPGTAGLYQVNLQVPVGVTRGAIVYLDVEVDDSQNNTIAYTSEAKIPIAQ